MPRLERRRVACGPGGVPVRQSLGTARECQTLAPTLNLSLRVRSAKARPRSIDVFRRRLCRGAVVFHLFQRAALGTKEERTRRGLLVTNDGTGVCRSGIAGAGAACRDKRHHQREVA